MTDVFFVIGAPRSGTTMLKAALNRHSQVVVPPETDFFTLLQRSRSSQIRHWCRIEKVLGVRLGPLAHRLRPGCLARQHFWRMAEAYIARVGKGTVTHFGEKTPDHQRRIPGILKTFPEARFVLIYRDGRDAALSLSKAPWMPHDLYLSFWIWLYFYRIQRRFVLQQSERVFTVRYEDLVQNPVPQLASVLEFLGLQYERQVAEGAGSSGDIPCYSMPYHWRVLQPITPERIGNWSRELSSTQIARLERWGGWALRELGYECMTDGLGMPAPWIAPWVYGRLAATVAKRILQRKVDDWFGTSFYGPNRLTRDLPEPPDESIKEHCVGRVRTISGN